MEVEELRKRVVKFEDKDYGICPAPLPAQEAVNLLIEHFLGDDWYVTLSMGSEQVNMEAVFEIITNNQKKKSLWSRFVTWLSCDFSDLGFNK